MYWQGNVPITMQAEVMGARELLPEKLAKAYYLQVAIIRRKLLSGQGTGRS